MSRRNVFWLVAIVVAAVVVTVLTSILWGVLAGVGVLVLSEVVERIRRTRRGGSAGIQLPASRRRRTGGR